MERIENMENLILLLIGMSLAALSVYVNKKRKK